MSNDVKIIDLGFCLESSYRKTAGYTPCDNMAPELKNKQLDQIDASTDFYEIGVLLEAVEKVRRRPLPHYLQKIKKRCLQHKKEARYANADTIIRAIKYSSFYTMRRIAAWAAALLFAYIGFTYTPMYGSVCDYIAWERGLIPEKFEENGVFFRVTDLDARTAEVTYKGNYYHEFVAEYSDTVILPAEVTHRGRTFKVTAIADDALNYNNCKHIVIEDGIKTIGKAALSRGGFIEGILHIPQSVESIGVGVVANCLYLKGIVVDADNPRYDSREGCDAIIETATNTLVAGCYNSRIPQGITTIGDYAFAGLQSLVRIYIPESVTFIGDYAFHSCAFQKVKFPQGLTHLGNYSFQHCEKLREVEIPESVVYIGEAALSNCGYSTLVIPDKVTFIGNYAFDQCHNLTTVTIGKNVTSIGAFAFDGCDKLTKITSRIPADKLSALDVTTFAGVANNCTLYVPRGAKATYQKSAGWSNFARIVECDL